MSRIVCMTATSRFRFNGISIVTMNLTRPRQISMGDATCIVCEHGMFFPCSVNIEGKKWERLSGELFPWRGEVGGGGGERVVIGWLWGLYQHHLEVTLCVFKIVVSAGTGREREREMGGGAFRVFTRMRCQGSSVQEPILSIIPDSDVNLSFKLFPFLLFHFDFYFLAFCSCKTSNIPIPNSIQHSI